MPLKGFSKDILSNGHFRKKGLKRHATCMTPEQVFSRSSCGNAVVVLVVVAALVVGVSALLLLVDVVVGVVAATVEAGQHSDERSMKILQKVVKLLILARA